MYLVQDIVMPQSRLQTESTLTDRYQTTVPSIVRKALHLGKKDKIKFTVEPNGSVTLSRAEHSDEDPALEAFLSFLGHDIQSHPQRIQPFSAALKSKGDSLVQGIEIDLDASLSDEDE
jgi:antitoxin PrlF